MARGWESKSVEEQISEKESKSRGSSQPTLTPQELQLRARRESLHMVRTRTLSSLQTACDSRYRAHLERVLADLDNQLRALDSTAASQD
jgi:hypothetical protein